MSRRSKLPHSLEVVVLGENDEELELEQWLPALAALPFCHSLELLACGSEYGYDDNEAFEEMAIRSGLATMPALRLLVSWQVLPDLAAERTARGLPCVVMRKPSDGRLVLSATIPSARFGQCTVLPPPHIDAAPSLEFGFPPCTLPACKL